jgi:hypothetical protein
MSPAAFLLIAIGVSLVGSVIVLIRAREPKRTMHDTISGFKRELAALSPERSPDAEVRETSRMLSASFDEHDPAEGFVDVAEPPGARRGAPEVLWRPEEAGRDRGSDYFGPLYDSGQEPG